ncbi:MAG: diguanylate cyclase [Chloroflexi bacterium]|nr:diguanylate cyclase [Chloroflexota bacterium]
MTDQEIQDVFLEQLAEDRQQIEAAWKALYSSKSWEEKDRTALLNASHRLAGAALTVGYLRIGNAAHLVESHLRQPGFQDLAALEKLVSVLFIEMDARVFDEASEWRYVFHPAKTTPSLHEARSASLIYLADDDPVLSDALSSQMNHFGYSIRTFSHLDDLRAALLNEIPAAILMDIMFPEGELAGIEAIQILQAEHNNLLPVIFLSVRDDVSARLQAIRAGGKNYFVKPVDVSALVDALDKVIVSEETEPYRVLIVDDSEAQAMFNAGYLKTAGIYSQIVTNPLDILRAIEEFLPDLILLDLYMPECTGLELAQVIRQMKAFVSLPIVYLSAETNREKQLAAIGLGGDDFLTKPIKPDHLISSVTSRIERYRQLRELMLRDSLTGLFNHTSIRNRLGQEIARSSRSNQPLTFAMVDIDSFKKVNDSHGHAAGDRVLKALSHLFTRRLRQSDIVGRYGGDEFVIVMPNTDETAALRILNDLREAFSLVRHSSMGNEFTTTLSCGLASFPKYQNVASLSEAADQAMYIAKRQGSNQVILAE